jgi:hypothetical protein
MQQHIVKTDGTTSKWIAVMRNTVTEPEGSGRRGDGDANETASQLSRNGTAKRVCGLVGQEQAALQTSSGIKQGQISDTNVPKTKPINLSRQAVSRLRSLGTDVFADVKLLELAGQPRLAIKLYKKLMKATADKQQQQATRAQRETEGFQKVGEHENLVKVWLERPGCCIDNRDVLWMEYMEGGDLHAQM